MSEELILDHCAPTLAGIKTGSLFTVRIKEDSDITEEVRTLNDILREKGLRVIPLKKTDSYALIYLYRPNRLKKDLNDPQAVSILKSRGYDLLSPEGCIVRLVENLQRESSFPHEIGLFLGYPPSDVECFIKNPNKGVKCCGCWKAYSRATEAKKTFVKYNKCREVYLKMNKKGRSLAQLTVATK